MKIMEISLDQRPRERLKQKGVEALNDAEILAVLLQSGFKGESVIDMSNRLISTYGLDQFNTLGLTELMNIKGIGIAKACKIIAAFELSKRVNGGRICEKVINSASDIADYYMEKLKDKKKEYFIAVFLDSKNKIIKDEVISIGTLNSSLVHPREVFESAIKHLAAGIIIAHNHPSGSLDPSDSDIKITKILEESGKLLGIPLEKHVIVTSVSFQAIPQKNLNSKYHILNI